MKIHSKFILALACTLSFSSAWAAGGSVPLEEYTVDRGLPAIKAGAQTIVENCNQCHSLKYIKYRHLLDIGFSKEEVDELRGDKKMNTPLGRVMDIEMVRDMFGLVPPDLSLMAKARKGGARYTYSLLLNYYTDAEGNTDNHLFPGIRMPDVMSFSYASDEAERDAIRQQTADVSAFLHWAADPNAAKRESLGTYVVAYLILLSLLYYLLKKSIWKDVKKRQKEKALAAAENTAL